MLLFPLAALVGVIAGFLFGGRLGGLAELRFRAPGILFGALVVQVALGVPPLEGLPRGVEVGLLLLSYATAGGWLALNAARQRGTLRAGLLLIAAGWLLNVAPIAANGGMPVSRAALESLGAPPDVPVEGAGLEKHIAADPSTDLAWLGDVIPLPAFGAVISAGDVVMLAGIATAVAAGMAPRRDRAERPEVATR